MKGFVPDFKALIPGSIIENLEIAIQISRNPPLD
jgi:hypothetical protein